ncbi:hypothetical protein QTO34_020136 [Cnephaeus nilssonii]|uniref:Uncharacterized protein n=1 Tax=Cnephaeus nilssonii TaxID=3371016 RepID=A0AA40HXX5_CNENI|nr:hypothetical protein QTO34_020136 [Eptesicus nilssonii]
MVGMGTRIDATEVTIRITGAHRAFALYKAIEEGVNHRCTMSAFPQHLRTMFVYDEDATLELKGKIVKYFKGLLLVHKLVDPLYGSFSLVKPLHKPDEGCIMFQHRGQRRVAINFHPPPPSLPAPTPHPPQPQPPPPHQHDAKVSRQPQTPQLQ